jgi:hypothetical protein
LITISSNKLDTQNPTVVKKTILINGPALFGISFLFSCSVTYVPKLKTPNHFKEKHELNVKASVGMPSYNAVAAGSITDHLFINASAVKSHFGFFNFKDTVAVGGTRIHMTNKSFEAGGGYFISTSENLFEIGAGYSRGSGNSFDPPPSGGDQGYAGALTSRLISHAYHAFYLQSAFGTQTSTWVHVAVICRFTALKYHKYQDNWPDGKFDPNKSVVLIEPAIDLRGNHPKSPVYIFGNIGVCMKASNGSAVDYWPFDLQVGLGIHLKNLR